MTEAPKEAPEASETRCGFVALIGAPNAGKSTLMNNLVGAKVTIVSPKVQTTRTRVLGIVILGASQIVFVDTPGIFAPRRRLDRAMVAAAWQGAADADRVVLLVDAKRGIDADTQAILDGLSKNKRIAILALNKVDLVKPHELLALTEVLNATGLFSEVFMISALTGDGVPDLAAHLADSLPAGPWLFPEDQISDMPMRLLAAEITREQLFRQLHQELPYALTVETEDWEERRDGSVRIAQVVYVQRDNQKAIVLGKGGQKVKAVGTAARTELEHLLERRVHLNIFVKVRQNWADDPDRYRDWGLDPRA